MKTFQKLVLAFVLGFIGLMIGLSGGILLAVISTLSGFIGGLVCHDLKDSKRIAQEIWAARSEVVVDWVNVRRRLKTFFVRTCYILLLFVGWISLFALNHESVGLILKSGLPVIHVFLAYALLSTCASMASVLFGGVSLLCIECCEISAIPQCFDFTVETRMSSKQAFMTGNPFTVLALVILDVLVALILMKKILQVLVWLLCKIPSALSFCKELILQLSATQSKLVYASCIAIGIVTGLTLHMTVKDKLICSLIGALFGALLTQIAERLARLTEQIQVPTEVDS